MHFITTQIGRLRLLAYVEGISFLLLLGVGMPLKYVWHMPEPNRVIGLIHGLLFVAYVLAVAQAKIELGWSWRTMGLALLASIIPLGTFWADAKLFRQADHN